MAIQLTLRQVGLWGQSQQFFTGIIILLVSMSHPDNKSIVTNMPTVFKAIHSLKQEQEKLIQERNRSKVLSRQAGRDQSISRNRQRQNQFFRAVRESSQVDQEIKRNSQALLIEEMKMRYSNNLRNRQQHRQMLASVRQTFYRANHEVYEQIKLKKQKNEELVRTQRQQHIRDRIDNRISANAAENLRRRSIQNFYESRSKERSQNKSLEIADILELSQKKRKLCDVVLTRNSRAQENRLKSSRMSSHPQSDRSPNKETIAD